MKCKLFLALIAAGVTACASAGVDESVLARDKADYAQLKPLAQQGDAVAQNHLGWMFANGRGVSQDYVQAAYWFRKAAEQENAQAQAALGVMYNDGKGVAQDFAQAVRWFRKAAEQGNSRAQSMLGLKYSLGEGVESNLVVAYALFTLAARDPASRGEKIRETIQKKMTGQQIEAGERLSSEMAKTGNVNKAIVAYLKGNY